METIRAFGPTMLRIARIYVRSDEVAEDVVREAWISVLENLERFQGRSAFRRGPHHRRPRSPPARQPRDTQLSPSRSHRTASRPSERSSRAPSPFNVARSEREGTLNAAGALLATVFDVDGWESWQRQAGDGAVESQQGVVLREPVVDFSAAGAECLGFAYWREVERVTRGAVRPRERNGALELRLFGHGPALLRFGRPTFEVTKTLARCSYPIEGGLLARRPAGEIVFAQVGGSTPIVRSTIRGFFPGLAARHGERNWTGALYSQVQSRVHVAISRRYFARLIQEARR